MTGQGRNKGPRGQKNQKEGKAAPSVSNMLRIHGKDAKLSLKRIRSTPLSSFMTIFVIAVALLLPALLFSLQSTFDQMLSGFQNSARFTLYLEANVSNGNEVSANLLADPEIVSTRYVSAEEALEQFSTASGFSGIIENLESNPLPAAIVVVPAPETFEAIDLLAQRLQDMPEVELVQVDSQWIRRLSAMSELLAALIRSLGLIVIAGLCFIVGNTIKLGVENRKDEIRVIKLVGGTNSFIARPFLYAGLLYGLSGGFLAWLLQLAVIAGFSEPLAELTRLFESNFEFHGLSLGGTLLLLLAGGLIGWFAALLASHRYIAAIDP